ncbi:MAG: RICIN domain-containing protein [Lachnospiraceae bacterium]
MKKFVMFLAVCLFVTSMPVFTLADEVEDSAGTEMNSDSFEEEENESLPDIDEEDTEKENEIAGSAFGSTEEEAEAGGLLTEEEKILASQKVPFEESELMEEFAVSGFSNNLYTIESAVNGQCLDVYAGSVDNGANADIYIFNGSSAQMFRIEQTSGGYYSIINSKSGKALDVSNGQASEGNNVWQYTRNGSAAQLWEIDKDGYYYVLRSRLNREFVLSVEGSGENFSNVVIKKYTGSTNQKWTFTEHKNFESIIASDIDEVYPYTGYDVEPEITVSSTRRVDIAVSQSTSKPLTGGLAVPLYVMGNYKDPYGSGTISSCGCGIVAFAMVATYLTGKDITPSDVVAWCGNKYWNGGTYMGLLGPDGAKHYGFEYSGQTTSVTEAMEAIRNGHVVVSLQQNGGYFTRGGHLIVLRGVTSTGGILVNDPNGFTSSNGKKEEFVPLSPALVDKNCSMYYIFGKKDENIDFGRSGMVKTVSSSTNLIKGVDYVVSYSNNREIGRANVKVTGSQSYSSLNKSMNFMILNLYSEEDLADGEYNFLSSLDSGMAVDVYGGYSANMTNVDIYNANGTDAQKWTFKKNNDGTYMIINPGSGKALDVYGGSAADGANVQIYTANNTSAQKWIPVRNSDYTYSFKNASSGKYLDIAGGSAVKLANIQINTGNGSGSQKFYLYRRGDKKDDYSGTYIIRSALNNKKAVDIKGGYTESMIPVQLYSSNNTDAQKFLIEKMSDDYYRVVNVKSGKAVDVQGGIGQNGSVIWQYSMNKTKAQLWKISKNSDGTVTFKSAVNESFVLDIPAADTRNGNPLQLYRSNGSKAQKWILDKVK